MHIHNLPYIDFELVVKYLSDLVKENDEAMFKTMS